MRERDPAGRVLALPNQTPGLIQSLDLSREDVDASAWTVDAAGAKLSGAAAVNRAWQELAGPWAGLSRLYRSRPLAWLEERTYRLVARHRSLLSRLWGDPPETGT